MKWFGMVGFRLNIMLLFLLWWSSLSCFLIWFLLENDLRHCLQEFEHTELSPSVLLSFDKWWDFVCFRPEFSWTFVRWSYFGSITLWALIWLLSQAKVTSRKSFQIEVVPTCQVSHHFLSCFFVIWIESNCWIFSHLYLLRSYLMGVL